MDDYGTDDTGALGADAAKTLAAKRAQQALLQQQLEIGQALLRRQPMQGYGLGGGIGAGLANLAAGLVGGLQMRGAQKGLPQNAAGQAGARSALLDALTKQGSPAAGASAPPLRSDASAPDLSGQMVTADVLRKGLTGVGAQPPQPAIPPMLDRNPQTAAQQSLLAGFPPPQMVRLPASPVADGASSIAPGAAPQPTQKASVAPGALTSGAPADPLAEAAQRDRDLGLRLVATGDPLLAKNGEALLSQAQQEREMDFTGQQAQAQRGFQGEQAQLGRDIQQQGVGMRRYSVTMSPYTGQALRLDHVTGEVQPIGIGGGVAGAPGMPGLGTHMGDAIQRELQQLQDSLDPSKFTGPASQDYQRIQLGQNLQGIIDQMRHDGVTPQLSQAFAADLNRLISGAAGSEGEVNALVQKSAGGDLQKLTSWLTGNPQGPEQRGFLAQMQTLLDREHGLAGQRIRKMQQQRLGAFSNLANNPFAKDRYWQIVNSFMPGSTPEQGGTQTQPPGSFSLDAGGQGGAPPMVEVISPEGVHGQIPADKLDAALKRGFKRG